MRTKADCSYCGFDPDEERRCPAYGKQCRNCERYSDFASVCRAEMRNQERYDKDTNETDSFTNKSDYEEDEDYFGETTKHIMKIHKVKTTHGTTDMEKTVTKRTYGNPVLERNTIKIRTLQNSLPIKGEFTTVIRNETSGTVTKFIVVKGEIKSSPLISKSTRIELGMLQIRADGSFTKPNHLRIQRKRCNDSYRGGQRKN
ncbi:unnamed protein product [Mytilus coruscus]|uniref:Uncharacterized protein n=1 Tax=Mytilus coruscus TaxID=42192 RepID=A0A6J8BIL5_MYTCO|nr:unnamed protein product [Mytilus coruscus]